MRPVSNVLARRIVGLRSLALVAGLMLAGCAVDAGPGYGYGGPVGVDYYEPYGVVYGGWDAGYNVGPYRGHGDWHGGGGAPGPRSFHAAPGGAPPSIPSGARGAGGGGHGGGGGGRR